MTLPSQLFDRYGSDKNLVNGYGPVYDALLTPRRESIRSVLEVGVHRGASLMAWHGFFDDAEIVGIDNNAESVSFWHPKVVTFLCNAADRKALNYCLRDRTFDLIVDDGFHALEHQVLALAFLWPRLNQGGLYVIEDVLDERNAACLGFLGGTVYYGAKKNGAALLVKEKE